MCVGTAAAARTAIKEHEVAFIVLNLFLPDLDGRAFLLQLRENTLTTSIPILVLAPKLTDALREEAQVLDTLGVRLPRKPRADKPPDLQLSLIDSGDQFCQQKALSELKRL